MKVPEDGRRIEVGNHFDM